MSLPMRKVLVGMFLVVAVAVWARSEFPMVFAPLTKAPTTRYHGYELNRIAIANAKKFTVLISNEGYFGVSRGTGVLIDATHVLTCAHVATDNAWIYPYPGRIVVHAKIQRMDKAHDLAIMLLDRSVLLDHYATFQEATYDGEPITIIGNALGGMQWFVSYGIVSGNFDSFILTDGTVMHGNSGGPWINELGQVVAISDWGLEIPKGHDVGLNGGVSAAVIRSFFDEPSGAEILKMLLGGN